MSLARRLFPAAAPGSLGMTVLFMFTAVSLFAIFWGRTNPVTIEVVKFDAGDVRQFAVHKVVAYPQQHLYIVGMPDGRLFLGCAAISGNGGWQEGAIAAAWKQVKQVHERAMATTSQTL